MKRKFLCGMNIALLSLVLLSGCGKNEVSNQEVTGNVQELEENITDNVEEESGIEDIDSINWAKAPMLSQTEWIDNRFAEDGTLLVECKFKTIEISGDGYELVTEAIREWTIKQEKSFEESVDLNEEYALEVVGDFEQFYGYSSTVEINTTRADASIISLKGYYLL